MQASYPSPWGSISLRRAVMVIEDRAGPHAAHVAQRLREMLIAAGLPLDEDIEDVL